MLRCCAIALFLLLTSFGFGQLLLSRDTITVIENNYVLKMPWANGLNYANVSTIDLNLDGKKDVVAFDRVNRFGVGCFRCFINVGNPGETKYIADPEMSHLFPSVANWAVFHDYNSDGLEDMFCSTQLGIMVYKNVSTAAHTPSFAVVKPLLYADYNPGGNPAVYNLYASSVGVPGIADMDNDGDLDIVDFSSLGVFVELYKNVGLEKYGTTDSLVFEYTNNCWGKVSESSCEVQFNACVATPSSVATNQKTYHAGSCLTCIDSDGDLDQDLILGDVSCDIVQYIYNSGTPGSAGAYFSDTTKLYPNYPAKGNTRQIKFNFFPCTYVVDVDGDSKKDLIATPNVPTGENYNSMWYYKNTSTTGTVNFQFVKRNFLQDEMIEVGQNSFPVVFDYNNDNKKDLLIGTYGYFTNDTLRAQLTLYENTGSNTQPSYSLVTRDYAGLSQFHLTSVVPTVGDIDNDGDMDICIGTTNGQVHWLKNTAGPNQACSFAPLLLNPFSFTTLSAAAAPQLFDMDNDGKLDLMIGMQNGRVAYYSNIGTAQAPSFTLVTNTFAQINVSNDPNVFGIDGYASPYFFRDGNDVKALIGSINGDIYYCQVTPNLWWSAAWVISPRVNAYNEGGQSAPCFEDVNGDGKRDLFIGTAAGGLSFFSSLGPSVGIAELNMSRSDNAVSVFPNPANDLLNVSVGSGFTSGSVSITDVLGKEILRRPLHSNVDVISISALPDGIYFAAFTLDAGTQNYTVTKKIIKSH